MQIPKHPSTLRLGREFQETRETRERNFRMQVGKLYKTKVMRYLQTEYVLQTKYVIVPYFFSTFKISGVLVSGTVGQYGRRA